MASDPPAPHPVDLNLPNLEDIHISSGTANNGKNVSKEQKTSKWKDSLTVVTHMLYAASLGDTAAITVLLDDGADVNSADYDGRSALHLASSEGRLETVDLLLRKGARVNAKDRWTHTPLTDAKKGKTSRKSGKFQEVAVLLEKHGGHETSPSDLDWEIDAEELDFGKGNMIGKGAFGEIRKVQWRGTPVAVKMVLPKLLDDQQIVKEFRDEVALLPKLRHPNVVQFLGSVTLSKPLMLVTEYLTGGDLHEVIKERGALPAAVAINYALDIARGMNYLHRHKPEAIIHRDLKPRNLLRDEGDHLKVADFGLSKLVNMNSLLEVYQMTGETGSYRYMAPEVFRHEKYDSAVDVYSFAIIFYEMFEGLPPFARTLTPEEVAWKTAVDKIRPPFKSKHYPPNCELLIAACWAPNPAKRPSFAQVIERLEPMSKQLKAQKAISSAARK